MATSGDGGTIEQRLRAAVESSPSGLLMIDSRSRIVLVNREVERLFGYSREEILGQPVEMLVPERFRQAHPTFRAGFMSDPSTRAMGAGRDLFGLRKDGSEVPVEIGLTPVETDEGLFVISSVVDITARKRADERFRVAVESSPNGVIMTDGAGRIVLVNREVERLFGYGRDELLGRSIDLLVPERFRRRHPSFRTSYHDAPEARAMGAGRDLFGLRKDGSEIPVEIGLNPITTDEGLFVLSSIVDISARQSAEQQRRQLEGELRQAQKMEAVGRLAGGIAHDFNNMLGAIVGYAELALDAASPDVAADLEEVLRAAARGKELVERILSFSRRTDFTSRPVDIATSVVETVRLLRATLPAGIDIRLEIESGLPRVLADATSIEQVLMNLATNAAHAMEGSGSLTVGLAPFYARDSFARDNPGLREGPYVLLLVHDTGCGMDDSVREHAFEPFFTTKGPGAGSGLGLAMVHSVVSGHGGTVWIESSVGRGTAVRCLFPVASEDLTVELARRPDLERGRGERVLYVDDEPELVAIGKRVLSALGYRVVTYTDPAAALAAVRDQPSSFDLLVTDYSMPGMNGVDLARRVRELSAGLPVLLLSGYVDDFPTDTLGAYGVRAVVRKPVTVGELSIALREALRPRS